MVMRPPNANVSPHHCHGLARSPSSGAASSSSALADQLARQRLAQPATGAGEHYVLEKGGHEAPGELGLQLSHNAE